MVSITYPAGDYCRIQSYGGTIMGYRSISRRNRAHFEKSESK